MTRTSKNMIIAHRSGTLSALIRATNKINQLAGYSRDEATRAYAAQLVQELKAELEAVQAEYREGVEAAND